MRRLCILLCFMMLLLCPTFAQKQPVPSVPAQEQTLSVFVKGKTLQLQSIKPGSKIEILNILGIRAIEKKTDSTSLEIQLDLPQGYYIVRVGDAVRKISIK